MSKKCSPELILKETEARKNWRFEKTAYGSVKITAFTGDRGEKDLVVPSVIGYDKVTEIGECAFCPWQGGISQFMKDFRKDSIKTIVVPDSVTCIGKSAFRECENLQGIVLPNKIPRVLDYTFYHCIRLKDIVLPEELTSIGACAFMDCEHLKSLILPGGVKLIDTMAFEGCLNLESVTLPEELEIIGNYVFKDTGIKSITLPDGITSIGENAFSDCLLMSITIPSSVVEIGRCAFSGCHSLTSVTISDGVKQIEDYAFIKCTSLTAITIPESVEHIGVGAFSGCKSLKLIRIDGQTKFMPTSFEDCPAAIIAPKIPLSSCDSVIKQSFAAGFALEVAAGSEITDERKEKYIKYIRTQRKKLYPRAIAEPALLRLMVEEKIIALDEFDSVFSMAQEMGNTENIAQLLDYQHQNAKPLDPIDELEREMELKDLRIPTKNEAKVPWTSKNLKK